MEKEKVGISARLKTKGLKNMGLIEVSLDSKTGKYVLFMSKGIHKKLGIFNFPDEMWKVKCSREELPGVVKDYLVGTILKG